MPSVGVRELKTRTSQVLRDVRRRRTEVDITHRGRVIARLVPVPDARSARRHTAAWSTLDRLSREIGRRWARGTSATKAVRDARREL